MPVDPLSCLHLITVSNYPRPGLFECDSCGHRSNAAGVEVADCYDCQRFEPVLDLIACADDRVRCDDCSNDFELARARERREIQRESAYEMAFDSLRDGGAAW